jgi:hypothetical protein
VQHTEFIKANVFLCTTTVTPNKVKGESSAVLKGEGIAAFAALSFNDTSHVQSSSNRDQTEPPR